MPSSAMTAGTRLTPSRERAKRSSEGSRVGIEVGSTGKSRRAHEGRIIDCSPDVGYSVRAARGIEAEVGTYRWLASVAEKGDEARIHVGVRAQAVWEIMADEGLIDPIVQGEPPSSRYAFLCYDAWDAVEAVAEERDEEGNITVEAVEARPAGNRFGIRPDQLTLFLIAAQEARIAALAAACLYPPRRSEMKTRIFALPGAC